ncbi:hypothetical protein EBR43_05740 [bacterium]|nr:hypothetical protein [bacterium]NBX72299.1 hypothetical protein [bacterium]
MLNNLKIYFPDAIFHQISEDEIFHGLCHDTRCIQKGDVFLALKGQYDHGVHFAHQAYNNGSIAILVDIKHQHLVNGPKIIVPDVLKAAYTCASMRRKNYPFNIAAVTGTAGKTSTKEYLAQIASNEKVFTTYANWNNLLGLIINLSRLNDHVPYNLFELGISAEGEMQELVDLLKPDIALITTIGHGHLEGLKSLEHVAFEKQKIAQQAYIRLTTQQALPFLDKSESWKVVDHESFVLSSQFDQTRSLLKTTLQSNQMIFTVETNGFFHLPSFALAMEVLHVQGMPVYERDRVLRLDVPIGRGRFIKKGDYLYIDDTYNANPLSLKSLFFNLQKLEAPSILVLGDLAELGSYTEDSLKNFFQVTKSYPLIKCLYYGPHQAMMKSFGFEVMTNENDLIKTIEASTSKIVAFKGSRVSRLDQLLQTMIARI